MTKGLFGLNLSAVAVLAFFLCYFTSVEALILVVAFALLIEKDRWLIKMTLQALFLRIAYLIVLTVIGWFFSLLDFIFGYVAFFSGAHSFVDFVIDIAFLLLAAYAALQLLRQKDLQLPLIGHMADYMMDQVKPKPTPVPVAPVAPPVYQQPVYTAPVYQQPVYTPPVVPAAPVAPVTPVVPVVPAAPVEAAPVVEAAAEVEAPVEKAAEEAPTPLISENANWICENCGRESFGKFCMSCGQPRK